MKSRARQSHKQAIGGQAIKGQAIKEQAIARGRRAPGLDVAPLLARALAKHRAGDPDARRLYRLILAADPTHSDALHLHGLVALQGGDAAAATRWIRHALAVERSHAIYRNSLGEALRTQGQIQAARQEYRRALMLNPSYVEAFANLLKQPPAGAEGIALLERYCRLRLATGSELSTVGEARLRAGRLDDARLAYRAAIAAEPGLVQAYVNLGATDSGAKRNEAAATHYRRALRLAPEHPGAWNNLASALWEMNEGPGATACCRRSIVLKPDHPDPYANLGYVTRSQARDGREFATAEALCRRALQLHPSHIGASNNLGILFLDTGRLDEAEAMFRRTLAADPRHADARFNLALMLLKAGRLAEGWEFYEARWDTGQLVRPKQAGRPWQGEPLNGASIALYAEQGHGDTLHFVRYAPMVAARGGRVRLVVQPALKRLMGTIPGIEVYGFGEPMPTPDFHCALLSLPGIFGTVLETVPQAVPYLFPPLDGIATWLGRPLPGEGLRVGLVWSGDSRPGMLRAHLTDRRRSMTLADFAPLAGIPGLRLVNLQMGKPAAQLANPPAGMELFDPMGQVGDFADTAALMLRLDLVITVDTSVAHLAGGLGKPVWVLSRYDGCWRWLQDRDDTPWYPTMRLFRQTAPGDWASVVRDVARALSELAAGKAAAAD